MDAANSLRRKLSWKQGRCMPRSKASSKPRGVLSRMRWIIATVIFAGVAFSGITFTTDGTLTVSAQGKDDQIAASEKTTVIAGGLEPITVNDKTEPTSPNANPTTFSNHSTINIPSIGNASPYPSIITVNSAGSRLKKVTVNLRALINGRADDLDIYLIAPNGAGTMLMSDAGGTGFNDQTFFTFDQSAATAIGDNGPLPTGTGNTVVTRPVNYESFNVDVFDPPGPGADPNFPANLDVFNGINPNGDWKLLVVDDTPGDNGTLTGGWDLVMTFDELVVNTTNDVVDSNGCTFAHCNLREAINDIPAGGKIKFSPLFNTPQTIYLVFQPGTFPPTGILSIDKNLTIEGPGPNLLTIGGIGLTDAFLYDGVFRMTGSTTDVTLSGMTITGGSATNGGGIYSEGSLTLKNCVVSKNEAEVGGGIYGNLVALYETSVTNNLAYADAGGNAGGVIALGYLDSRNSTISGNRIFDPSPNSAGGVYVGSSFPFPSTINYTTVTNNYAPGASNASGVFASNSVNRPRIANSIIAGNVNNSVTPDVAGFFISDNFNIIGNRGAVTTFNQPFDQTGTNGSLLSPQLAPLNLYGGNTPTHGLLGSSTALDKGGVPQDAEPLTFDQRGSLRPVDVAAIANVGNGSDIGSFESGNTLIVNKTADTNDGSCTVADCSLREAIAAAPSGGIVYFSGLFSTPQTITLGLGELVINKNLAILGTGANLTTISGNSANRVLITSSTGVFTVILQGLTISNGFPSSGAGGAISNNGNLTVSQCHVKNSLGTLGGGIFNGNLGTLTVFQSTISNNTAINGDTGGGIDSRGALNVISSTVSGNSANVGNNNAGGIRFAGSTPTTLAKIENSTITNNTTAGTNSVGGLRRTSGVIDLFSTIVAGNANNVTTPDIAESGSSNITAFSGLIGNPGTIVFAGNNRVGAPGNPLNPQLSPLADNGGPTPTHAIASATSPAINSPNAWIVNAELTDQRGLVRSYDDNIQSTNTPDIGAFEAQGVPIPAISISDVSQNEGNSGTTAFVFNVNLSAASPQTVTVSYQTADGTATGGSDYIAVGASVLTFNPNETAKTITILVNGDTTIEPNESFFVNLSNPTNAGIADSQALGTIQNDESGGCPPASPITFGQTASGNLQSGDCTFTDSSFYDAYTFNGTAGQQISIAMNSSQFNSYLFLYQGSYPGGTLVAQDNNSGGGNNARIPASGFLTLPSTGTYTILANSFAAGETGSYSLTLSANSPMSRAPFDYDGDNKTDISIFRPGPGEWWLMRSSNGSNFATQFGTSSDKMVPADYTGDGRSDIAFWRPSNGNWFILRSEDFTFFAFPFGAGNDVPIPADFDGDGKADPAVFRPSTLNWFVNKSGGGTDILTFGAAGDKPTVADYDGDGKADVAVFRPNGAASEWWIRRSSNASVLALQFGGSTDRPVQGDFTGDGKADVAFWRPSNGNWFVLRSEDLTFFAFPFGATGDTPVPGDYDGDGKIDAGVFRPTNVTWYIQRSTAGTLIQAFGAAGDIPTPSAYVP